MAPRTLLVANWKMNLGIAESVSLARAIAEGCSGLAQTEIWLAPSFTALAAVKESLSSTPVKVGAQNAHWADSGAFTGEVSVPMLKECGATFAIVGHSERRHILGESDLLVVKRAAAVAASGMQCIFCVGEKLEERERGLTSMVLQRQLIALLDGIDRKLLPNIILAYEPVWAIGTGKAAEVEDIASAHAELASIWMSTGHQQSAPRILYGGSVSPENFHTFVHLPSVGGALVGGASLVAEKFTKLAKISEQQQ